MWKRWFFNPRVAIRGKKTDTPGKEAVTVKRKKERMEEENASSTR